MLISRSPVFCAMFTGQVKDENTEIKIEDVDEHHGQDAYESSVLQTVCG